MSKTTGVIIRDYNGYRANYKEGQKLVIDFYLVFPYCDVRAVCLIEDKIVLVKIEDIKTT